MDNRIRVADDAGGAQIEDYSAESQSGDRLRTDRFCQKIDIAEPGGVVPRNIDFRSGKHTVCPPEKPGRLSYRASDSWGHVWF
jgi:hypothetical protein